MEKNTFNFNFEGPEITYDYPKTLRRSKSFSNILQVEDFVSTPKKSLYTEKINTNLKKNNDEIFKSIIQYYFNKIFIIEIV